MCDVGLVGCFSAHFITTKAFTDFDGSVNVPNVHQETKNKTKLVDAVSLYCIDVKTLGCSFSSVSSWILLVAVSQQQQHPPAGLLSW